MPKLQILTKRNFLGRKDGQTERGRKREKEGERGRKREKEGENTYLVEVDVLVLLGNDGLQVAIDNVGNSEGLQHTGVGVSEVAILHLERESEGADLMGYILV
jgi:hypothetical protein